MKIVVLYEGGMQDVMRGILVIYGRGARPLRGSDMNQ